MPAARIRGRHAAAQMAPAAAWRALGMMQVYAPAVTVVVLLATAPAAALGPAKVKGSGVVYEPDFLDSKIDHFCTVNARLTTFALRARRGSKWGINQTALALGTSRALSFTATRGIHEQY